MTEGNRTVFIGNIPYGVTESIIEETLRRVGHVVSFRMLYDKDTGKPKGFAFAEFGDHDAAASAVRNLNDTEMMGRKLRVDWSNDGSTQDSAPAGYRPNMNGGPEVGGIMGMGAVGQPQAPLNETPASLLPPLPAGVDLPPNLSSPNKISETLKTLPPTQLLDILSQMQGLVRDNPQQATLLLHQAPQIAYAVFQALMLLDLVDARAVSGLIDPSSQHLAPAPAPTPQLQQPPPPPPQQYQQHQQQGYPGGYPHPQAPIPPHLQQQQHVPTPPQQQQQGPPDGGLQPELLNQLRNITPQMIDALPPAERAHILQLRQQFLGHY
ncbi:hypothetical protein K402DRAFT_382583 [Aulographum hederae CBS 113979]|uniref:RRM domain-containing protein n=1 Tax=Aulographum hederae CBS 113979 TaxID=1176131 RepID=A0A6G1GRB1_9PEZI|nr:hypothetical protein K402DRAFT_382583 [Aulographum hederae CBS 113979]